MAKTPKDLHVTIKVDTSALDEALQRLERAAKALEAIRRCPAATFQGSVAVRCELVEGHREMAGTRHRARYGRLFESTAEWG